MFVFWSLSFSNEKREKEERERFCAEFDRGNTCESKSGLGSGSDWELRF